MVWAAFLIGFAGSFHCVGMCGPLAMAVPMEAGGKHRWFRGLTYQSGRILTYTLLGLLFGGLGYSSSLAGVQQAISIVLGCAILLGLVFPRLIPKKTYQIVTQPVAKLKATLGAFLRKKGLFATFTIGLLNGLLPCGLVYLALAGAMATFHPAHGALFMMFFGLGTLPFLLGISMVAPYLTPIVRQRFRQMTPYIVGIMGVLLIARGLDLNIPYVSPILPDSVQAEIHECH